MTFTAARAGWLISVRGLLALIAALVCLSQPLGTHEPRTALLGIYLLGDGIACMLVAATARAVSCALALALAGIAGLVAGAYVLTAPHVTSGALATLVAFWSLIVGMTGLVFGGRVMRDTPGPVRILERICDVRLPRGQAQACEGVLAGIVAVACGVLLLLPTGDASDARTPLMVAGAAAAFFGYLNLRVGLALATLALAAPVADDPSKGRRAAAEAEGIR